MWRVYLRNNAAAGPWVTRLEGGPGWVIKAAILATVMVVVIPIVLLCAAALMVGAVVFLMLTLIAKLASSLQNLFRPTHPHASQHPVQRPADPWADAEGRRNVRVRR